MEFNFQATAIGSLGHMEPKQAADLVLKTLKEIPAWPQLPQRSFRENMYVQFSEGIPGIIIEDEKRKIYVDTHKIKDEETTAVYENFLAQNPNSFSISKGYAAGFYEFLTQIKEKNRTCQYLKGQITGPVSFLLTVTDENKRPLIYHSHIADVILKILIMKAKWQVRRFKKVCSQVILFIDEPYLVSIGSGYVSLDREELHNNINEIVEEIHREGAIAGIHCCGNTDWSFLTQTKTDIISFDAYNFSDSLALYPRDINNFLEKGGTIAWGIVPTNSLTQNVSLEELLERLDEAIKLLINKGIPRELICSHSLVTPSCGLGGLSPQEGETILKYTQKISEKIRS